MSRSLINAAFALIVLTGCQTLITSPDGAPSTERVTIDRKPTGSPLVHITPNSTSTEWTITVTRDFEDTEEIHTFTPQKARRYLAWPLAPLNGIIQCPVGLLLSSLSSHQVAATMREVGCMRLAAMEPLGNTTTSHTITIREIETQHHRRPVAGADILFRDHESDKPIHAITDSNGQATLQGVAARPLAGPLTVTVANQLVLRQDICIAPRTTTRPQITIPIPKPLIIQVTSSSKMGFDATIEERLRQTLLTNGLTVLPPNYAQAAILNELRFQTTGKVEDSTQVRSGPLMRPTVVITVTRKNAGPYAIQLLFVMTGQQQELEVESLDEIGALLSGRK